MDFRPFPKIPRLNREIVITEKIDGTNALVAIHGEPLEFNPTLDLIARVDGRDLYVRAGSRNRWLTLGNGDNYGFASWVYANVQELAAGLGEGYHYGEWWGQGIQRRYGLDEKRFSLFNVGRWVPATWPVDPEGMKRVPACCHVVPLLYRGEFCQGKIVQAQYTLKLAGSSAAPGFRFPEGIIVYHTASGQSFKVTLEDDEKPKAAA